MRSILALFLTLQSAFIFGEWRSDVEQAVQEARDMDKPILFAFVGSSWCPWSQKLEKEVLNHPSFQKAVEAFALIKVDLPEFRATPRGATLQFDVQETPLFVLTSSKQEEIAKMGYLPLPAEEFAALFNEIKATHDLLSHSSFTAESEETLQRFYLQALKFGFNSFREEILQVGLKTGKTPFFLLEKYKLLIEEGKGRQGEVVALKKELIRRDPQNQFGVHRTLAVVEFHELSNRYRLRKKPDQIVKPLVEYVKQYGQQDQEHLWKIQMMIAQFYFSRNKVGKAVAYAEESYEGAPEEARGEITESIAFLKARL